MAWEYVQLDRASIQVLLIEEHVQLDRAVELQPPSWVDRVVYARIHDYRARELLPWMAKESMKGR